LHHQVREILTHFLNFLLYLRRVKLQILSDPAPTPDVQLWVEGLEQRFEILILRECTRELDCGSDVCKSLAILLQRSEHLPDLFLSDEQIPVDLRIEVLDILKSKDTLVHIAKVLLVRSDNSFLFGNTTCCWLRSYGILTYME
jgi:hypothetical protein